MIKILPTPLEVAEEAARRVIELANDAIQNHDTFSIVLAGGSTPKVLYEMLASDGLRDQIEWAKVRVFFGDERSVPPDHADSNYGMAHAALLSKVPIPGDNIYRMRGEIDPHYAAVEYGQILKDHFGDAGPDLVLLGMGEDGHTASLFPETEALKETKHRCVSNYVPKLGVRRITMTAPFINRAAAVLVMVVGVNKAKAVHDVLEGPPDPDRLPIQSIEPASGKLIWLMDVGAAGMDED
jgi:6-phosphogluconolactonase